MSKDSKILIVEDEQHINRLIELVLLTDGYYKIRKAYDGEEALKLIKEDKPDLILMDVMIPEIDGFTLCKIIKDDDYLKSIQVIMLTAKKLEDDILNGFKTGAIDYITKPFSNKILLARINAHLENVNSDIKLYKDVVLDEKSFAVKVNNKAVELTHFEFKLIKLFISNAGKVFSRSALLQYLRGDEGFDVSERAIDVQILNLRRKLGSLGENIKTVRGFGYKLKGLNDE
ncbi:TPA: DNA-binding response regulator [Candidatus Gastranaerophilales bacterium HUM_20]|nr:response regulator with CheY-like receiver domain and winged-helix DNA-binding domain [Clostridium sp. CAG:729]DAB20355.1 MAG TPA: DNA-binding response regulator [Candidatus Gastranaerophilales bacterium HUM_20]